MEEPQREAVGVELLLELFDALALLVLDVDEESLEVEEVEGCGREKIKRVCLLLFGLVLAIVISAVVLWFSGSFLRSFNFLFLCLDDWLDCLSCNLNVAGNLYECGELSDTLKPSSELGHSLSEATVKECLLSDDEEGSQSDVCQSDCVTHKPVASQSTVNSLSVGLYLVK